MDETPKNLWEDTDGDKYQVHVTIPTIDSTIESENVDERVVYIEDVEKRIQAYGICGECKEPGTGWKWCQPCNAKRFKDNFKNWTSGNKDIDEFIQQSQLNAVHHKKYLEWIPFGKFQNINYIAKGGFDFLDEIKSYLQIHFYDIVQCYGITQNPNNKDSDTSYTAQSTSENLISECLDVQLSELELNDIYQDDEHNIE
ncbi:kinase-like domain-containing protein [Rhizophagus irregularis DAOM 181602=DAOM 197198]|nr:kinase-like domain-containing protein [Rhizophagus irregularis DAOM 181602=DAOM 197198]